MDSFFFFFKNPQHHEIHVNDIGELRNVYFYFMRNKLELSGKGLDLSHELGGSTQYIPLKPVLSGSTFL